MIAIILLTEEINTSFTLSSLLKKSENYRLHLFTRCGPAYEQHKPLIDYALKNFREVYCYQAPFEYRGKDVRGNSRTNNRMARVILQFREHWKDKQPKGAPIERVIVHTQGCRIFNGAFAGNIPTVKQMGDNLAYLSRKHQYFDHPFYGNYYKILDLPVTKGDVQEDFILLNWKLFKDLHFTHYFLNGKASRYIDHEGKRMTDKDSFVLSASTAQLINNIKKRNHGFMPLYFDMTVDELIKKEAIGPKDVINHNTMMRKAFSLNATALELYANYFDMPTLHYMAVPWDLWAKQIDDIPYEMRREGVNERLLTKADKQKKYLRKVYEAGYLLGKI